MSGSLSPSDFGFAGSCSSATGFAWLGFVAFAAGPSDSGLPSSSSFVAEADFASSLSLPDSVLLSVFEAADAPAAFPSDDFPSDDFPFAAESDGWAFASLLSDVASGEADLATLESESAKLASSLLAFTESVFDASLFGTLGFGSDRFELLSGITGPLGSTVTPFRAGIVAIS